MRERSAGQPPGQLVEGLLHTYIASLPLLGSQVTVRIGWKAVAVSDLAFAVFLAALVLDRHRWRRPSPVDVGPPLALLLAVLLAMLASPQPGAAIADVARIGYSMVVFLVMSHLRFTAEALARVRSTWVVTAGLVAVVGLLAWCGLGLGLTGGGSLAWVDKSQLAGAARLTSTLTTNALPLYFGLSTAFALPLLAGGSRAGQWCAQSTLLAIAAAAPLTMSRGLAGLAVSSALMAGASRKRYAPLWRVRWVLVAAALGVSTFAAATTLRLGVFIRSDGSVATASIPGGYAVVHGAAWRMFLGHPVLGIGPGRFGRELAAHTSGPIERKVKGDRDPHSTWLGWAAEGGLAVVSSLMFLWGSILRRLLARPDRWESRLAAAALVGVLLNGLHVEMSHLKFVWAFAGIALARPTEGSPPTVPGRPTST